MVGNSTFCHVMSQATCKGPQPKNSNMQGPTHSVLRNISRKYIYCNYRLLTWMLVNSIDVHSLYTNIGGVVKIEDTISSEGFRNCIRINSISSIESNCSTTTPLYVMIEKHHKSLISISSQDSLESVYLWK